MRISVHVNQDRRGGLVTEGGSMSGPLILQRDPVDLLDAVSKQYVDRIPTNLDAGNIKTGTLLDSMLGPWLGEVYKSKGTRVIDLRSVGMSGIHCKVVVNDKGLVVNGAGLDATDVPGLNWNKFNINMPTDLAGYGILDGVSTKGDYLLGPLKLETDPNSPKEIATKNSVDNQFPIVVNDRIQVGDISRKATEVTPPGFLRANGAAVSTVDYSELYEVIGDRYGLVILDISAPPAPDENVTTFSLGGPGASNPSGGDTPILPVTINVGTGIPGKPWSNQHETNFDGNMIGTWSPSGQLPFTLEDSQIVVVKNRVYILGGTINSNISDQIYTTTITETGTLGTWTLAGTLPVELKGAQAVITSTQVYLLGGLTNTGVSDVIYRAPMNQDGSLDSWVTDGKLPVGICDHQAVIVNGKLHVLGGRLAAGPTYETHKTEIDPDGLITNWVSGPDLPTTVSGSQAIVTASRVYLAGGWSNSGGAQVYVGIYDSSGNISSWSTTGSLPRELKNSRAIVTNNRAYLLGGFNAWSEFWVVYTAPVSGNGVIGLWSESGRLPSNLRGSHAVITSNRVYLLGGGDSDEGVSDIISASFAGGANDYFEYTEHVDPANSEMIIGGKPWKHQYDINLTGDTISEWALDPPLPTEVRNPELVVVKNKVYLLGGIIRGEAVNDMYSASIYSNGRIGEFTSVGLLPYTLYDAQTFVTKNRVYLVGGLTGVYRTPTSKVYVAFINPDGSLGEWIEDVSLPVALHSSQAIAVNNRIHLVGGKESGTVLRTVYTAPINEDGTIGTWTTGTSLPKGLHNTQVIFTKDRVYTIGGNDSETITKVIYTATVNPDGTLNAWSFSGNLPLAMTNAQAVVTRKRVHLLGGLSYDAGATNPTNTHSAPINLDGTIGSWSVGVPLSRASSGAQALITSSGVYLLGGVGGELPEESGLYAPFTGGLNNYFNNPIEEEPVTPPDGGIGGDNTVPGDIEIRGSGKPWRQQYDFNLTGEITSDWVLDQELPVPVTRSQIIVTKNRVHLLGGLSVSDPEAPFSGPINTIYSSSINADGTLTSWIATGNLPNELLDSQAILTKNRVFLFGGYAGPGDAYYSATIEPDGSLGTWSQIGLLPDDLANTQALATKNRVYLLGGEGPTGPSNVVYVATINTDGSLGKWLVDSSLPANCAGSQLIVTKNRVYSLGGTDAGGVAGSAIFTAIINSDGTLGTWSTAGNIPSPLKGFQTVVTRNRAYLLGGSDQAGNTNSGVTVTILTDGTLGSWGVIPGISTGLIGSQAFVVKNKVYMVGGHTPDQNPSSKVYSSFIDGGFNDYSDYYDPTVAPTPIEINIHGGGKPWKHQHAFNDNSEDIVSWVAEGLLPATVVGSQVIVTKYRAYLLGGMINGFSSSEVYTAPISSDGVLGTWTLSGNLPMEVTDPQAIVLNNKVYLLGGNYHSGPTAETYVAPIRADGTLGKWVSDTDLPKPTSSAQALIVKNRVHLLTGGDDLGMTTKCHSAPITNDGTIGVWTESTSVETMVVGSQVVLTNSRVYLLGGMHSNAPTNTVQYAPILEDGVLGPWVLDTSLPAPVAFAQAFATKHKAHLVGGQSSNGLPSPGYVADILSDGSLGPWRVEESLPVLLFVSQLLLTNSKVYVLGGISDGFTLTDSIYSTPLNGGLNDYTDYYDPLVTPTPTGPPATEIRFKLPDLSTDTGNGKYTNYIKY